MVSFVLYESRWLLWKIPVDPRYHHHIIGKNEANGVLHTYRHAHTHAHAYTHTTDTDTTVIY